MNELQKVNGSVVKIVRNSEDELDGVFFQDEHMKKYFNSFPEIGTYVRRDI